MSKQRCHQLAGLLSGAQRAWFMNQTGSRQTTDWVGIGFSVAMAALAIVFLIGALRRR